MSAEREPAERAVLSSFKEKYPKIYSILYQVILLIITFECAIAIARYGPERDDPAPPSALTTAPRTLLPRYPLSKANSTTPHICKYGAREDYVDVGPLTAITPYAVLCPSTPFFLLSLVTYISGIIKFNVMHKDDDWLGNPRLGMMFIMILFSIDWRHIFISLQIFAPMNIWSASIILAVSHWLFRTCFPRTYEKLREAKRKAEEEVRAKTSQKQRERDGYIEAGMEGEGEALAEGDVEEGISEETPLRS